MTTPAEPDNSVVVDEVVEKEPDQGPDLGIPGPRFDRKAPYLYGFLLGLGLLSALAVGWVLSAVSGVLIQIIVAFFIAAGLNPSVSFFERRGSSGTGRSRSC